MKTNLQTTFNVVFTLLLLYIGYHVVMPHSPGEDYHDSENKLNSSSASKIINNKDAEDIRANRQSTSITNTTIADKLPVAPSEDLLSSNNKEDQLKKKIDKLIEIKSKVGNDRDKMQIMYDELTEYMDSEIEKEQIDLTWSSRAESDFQDWANGEKFNVVSLQEIKCRSITCRAVVDLGDESIGRQFLSSLRTGPCPGAYRSIPIDKLAEEKVIIYCAKHGSSLPNFQDASWEYLLELEREVSK